MKTVGVKPDPELLTTGKRWGELISVVALLLVFGFLAYHQVALLHRQIRYRGDGLLVRPHPACLSPTRCESLDASSKSSPPVRRRVESVLGDCCSLALAGLPLQLQASG